MQRLNISDAFRQAVPMIIAYPAVFTPLPRLVVIAVYELRDGFLHQRRSALPILCPLFLSALTSLLSACPHFVTYSKEVGYSQDRRVTVQRIFTEEEDRATRFSFYNIHLT
ncbi:hypothetical protein IG631_12206 [Alternaria alternata]|jgi:hypothetical protein|nr:hypothetical protein IG631_12206 [Alternaria alternata]